MTMHEYNHSRGFTLIEVLVAMLIVAIGLLSIVALQFQGLKYNHEAYLRSQINYLAYDISESIRLNRDSAADYIGNYTVPTPVPDYDCDPALDADADDGAAIADNDLNCWYENVSRALPPGSIANISQNGDTFIVTLAWLDKNTNTTAPNQINFKFQPAPSP